MGIIQDTFMLRNKTGRELYESYAADMPIIDYHCHLDPALIAEDHRFQDAFALFLGDDHYKWRQMRSFGIDEAYITGDKPPYEKWCAFASCMPYLIGNPLYHWTALELKRYFGIDQPLSPDTAKNIWDICAAKLQEPDFSARNLIRRSNVTVLCTTNDPSENLEYHKQLLDEGFTVSVLPTFRPDKAVDIEKDSFPEYIRQAGASSFDELLAWLESRMLYFHQYGCRLSDHSLTAAPFAVGDAADVFEKRMSGFELDEAEAEVYKTAVLLACARKYAELGWTMQLHLGALRNNNRRLFEQLGPDIGCDSINDCCVAENLSRFMDELEYDGCLPKTILYNLNPKDNYVLGAMLGNFQSGPVASKIQLGSGWWFNDNRDGMEAQLKTLANLGLLGKFVGMLTDSRSFVSYPRHEYFRRILCNLLGEWVENGEYPDDRASLEKIVKGICFQNAKDYFQF